MSLKGKKKEKKEQPIEEEVQVYLRPSLRELGLAESPAELYYKGQSVEEVQSRAMQALGKNIEDIRDGVGGILRIPTGHPDRRKKRLKIKNLIRLAKERAKALNSDEARNAILSLEREFYKDKYL